MCPRLIGAWQYNSDFMQGKTIQQPNTSKTNSGFLKN
jgi:hypothetical protein